MCEWLYVLDIASGMLLPRSYSAYWQPVTVCCILLIPSYPSPFASHFSVICTLAAPR